MKSICLSLGHNSSAVLVEDGRIIIGYEEERLSRIKSDSAFPIKSIDEIGKYHNLKEVERIYISHWETFGKIEGMSHKHMRFDLLKDRLPNATLMNHIDHHDAHVEILRVFHGGEFDWEIIADGFGNFNETVSIYHKGKLILRSFGFDRSIGLLYQYTTAYLGMKMNQDEYKLLGYEVHIGTVSALKSISKLRKVAEKKASKLVEKILSSDLDPKFDLVAGLEALPNTRLQISKECNAVFTKIGVKKSELSDIDKKIIIAYYVQYVTENTIMTLVKTFGMRSVALSGGIFMNVKLNNAISSIVDRICILPICGDQSGGLGAYQYSNKDLIWPEHLFWGKRDLSTVPEGIDKLIVAKSRSKAISLIDKYISKNHIVNLVVGNMEFGARALGHTSTLALPTIDNVEYINRLNGRDTIMPMAGMISHEMLSGYIDGSIIHKSLEYMIMTLDYKGKPKSGIMGCHHIYPTSAIWSNRVQLIYGDHILYSTLEKFGMMINTSFNRHGVPIVFSVKDIIETHNYQLGNDIQDRFVTIIVKE